jgi:hypothetical protein
MTKYLEILGIALGLSVCVGTFYIGVRMSIMAFGIIPTILVPVICIIAAWFLYKKYPNWNG